MRKIANVAVATCTTGALLLGAAGSASASTGSTEAAKAPAYAASQAFEIAAADLVRDDTVAPTAIPAIVGTAFVAGAAAGAGKVVAGWAAKKVIGRWDIQPTLEPTQLD